MFSATINGRKVSAEFLAGDLPGLFGRRIEVAVRISVGRHKELDAVYACDSSNVVERFPNPDGTDALARALRVAHHQLDEALEPIRAEAQRLYDAAKRKLDGGADGARMLNPLELYADAGRKAGEARNQRDESRAAFNEDWLRRALALEKPEHRRVARAAFDAAYREASSWRPA